MKESTTYTVVIFYSRWEPDWEKTVRMLAELANVALVEFTNHKKWFHHIYIFEVFGPADSIVWFANTLRAEDRKRTHILYEHMKRPNGHD